MDAVPCSLADVIAALTRGATVITGNQRAARTLHTLYRSQQQSSGTQSWHSPIILPWEAWTASLWQQLIHHGHEERLLLNPQQELLLWRELIDADEDLATLRTTDALATLAADAFALLHRYGGRSRLARTASTGDARAFARWAGLFDDRCRTEKLLASAALENELTAAIAQGHVILTGELLFLGFDGLTPAQQRLLTALESSGASIRQCSLQHEATTREGLLIIAGDLQSELAAAAQWVRTILQRNPSARIAILVPSLDDERAELDRVLRTALAPEATDIAATTPLPYEFSLGSPLAAYPMVAAAIELLRWTLSPLPIERIGTLLLSPYLSTSDDLSDRSLRAEFDAYVLRESKLLRPELTLRNVLDTAHAPKHHSRYASIARQLASVQQHAADQGLATTRKRHRSEWMDEVRAILRAAGWPGARTLDSLEFQLLRKWESTLDQLATLDFTGDRVPFATALRDLEHSFTTTRFAPQSHNAPVQVMGILESTGSVFDAVWFLRGSDAWPPRTAPNPLLPWPLQRSLAMPGTNHARAQQEARAVIQRITDSAPQIVFSYAATGSEGPQRRSSLFAQLPWPEQQAIIDVPTVTLTVTEPVSELPLPPLPSPAVRGGHSVLRLQAACGFRAFAEHRLFSTTLDSVATGLNPSEWGILIHDVVRRFWSAVQTQANLRAMDDAARNNVLAQSIAAAFRQLPSADSPWDIAYLETVQQRLHSLLSAWTARELDRPPFTVLLSEEATEAEVGPLRLTLRIDRVDQVEAGEVLIDYKTGNAKASSWQGPRPDEPQLPLYAAFARKQPLQAIAFANLRPGKEMKFEGYDAGNKALPVKQADIFELLAEWHNDLYQLAHDFAQGRATLNPKNYPATCRHCSQRILCRLNPADLLADDTDEAEDADV